MAQPPPYAPVTSFLTYQAQQAWFPGQQLDVEFNAIKTSIGAIETNMALIQQDDGALLPGIVGWEQLTGNFQFQLQSQGFNPASNAPLNGLVITVANGSALQGLLINQQPAGTVTTPLASIATWFNEILVTNWNVNATLAAVAMDGVNGTINGANAWSGAGAGLFGYLSYLTVLQQSATPGSFHTGLGGIVFAKQSHTLSSSTSNWGICGVNGNVIIDTNITGVRSATGAELDVTCRVGSTTLWKIGALTNLGGSDHEQGSLIDGSFVAISSENTTLGWKYGVLLDTQTTGCKLMDAAGTLFGTRGSHSVGFGVDISSATCATAEWKSAHALLNNTGKLILGTNAFTGGAAPLQVRMGPDTNFVVTSSGVSYVLIEAVNDALNSGIPLFLFASNWSVDNLGNAAFSGNGVFTGNVSGVNGTFSGKVTAPAGLSGGYYLGSVLTFWNNGGFTFMTDPTSTSQLAFGSSSAFIKTTTAFFSDPTGVTNFANISASGFLPGADNTYTLGNSTHKWSDLRSVTGTFTGSLTAPTLTSGANQVVGARQTGWTVATGTPQRSTFTTSGVTLAQLAGVVMALEQDLIAHGLIGT